MISIILVFYIIFPPEALIRGRNDRERKEKEVDFFIVLSAVLTN